LDLRVIQVLRAEGPSPPAHRPQAVVRLP